MQDLTKIRNDIHTALKHKASAEDELKSAQQAYDEKLAEFEVQNPKLVSRRNQAIVQYDQAGQALTIAKASAKQQLASEWLDELPEGFKQKSVQTVIYDSQGFHKQALESFPFLLTLNEIAIDKFFTSMVDEQPDGSFILPENIRSLANVVIINTIDVIIDEEVIKKLTIDQTQDLSIFADALEDLDSDSVDSPVDEQSDDVWFYCEKCEHEVTKTEKTCQTCGEELLPVDATSTDKSKTVVPLEEIKF